MCRCCQLTPIDTISRWCSTRPSSPPSRRRRRCSRAPTRLGRRWSRGFKAAGYRAHRGLGARPGRAARRHRPQEARPRRHPPGDPVGPADAEGARPGQEAGERRWSEARRHGVSLLGQGVQSLDQARQRDFAFAKSLLKLPTFSAPEIGSAFFGKVSIDRFKQALYWAELAQHYMPPGLLPARGPGPQAAAGCRARRSSFPKAKEWPSFLMQLGQLDFTIGGASSIQGAYTATVAGADLDAGAVRPPGGGRRAKRDAPRLGHRGSIDVGAVDRPPDRSNVHDSASARLAGRQAAVVRSPRPAVPARRRAPAPAASSSMETRATSCWAAGPSAPSRSAGWLDSAAGSANEIEQLVWRVVSGLKRARGGCRARAGTVKSPKLSVSSNLDKAIAQRLKAVVGRGGGQGRGDGPSQGGQPGGGQGRAGEAADRGTCRRRRPSGWRTEQAAARSGAGSAEGGAEAADRAGWRRGSSCRRSRFCRASCTLTAHIRRSHPRCGVPMRIGVPRKPPRASGAWR